MRKLLTLNDFKYDGRISTHLSHEIFGFFDLDTHQTAEGVTRFQGLIFYKGSEHIKPDFYPTLDMLKSASGYCIHFYTKNDLPYLIWTIWFKEPYKS